MTHLKEGDLAPAISGVNQDGKIISLKNFKGKKVILYFYPRDNTPGCTAEACDLRDNYEELQNFGFDTIGVSTDSIQSHKKFIEKHNLPFHLIADTDKRIVKDYGVWGEKKMAGKVYDGLHRTTFIISEDGIIEKIIKKVDTKNHTQQIYEELKVKE